jgi:hypothetical protein
VSCGSDNIVPNEDTAEVSQKELEFTVTYELTFTSNWTGDNFPTNYPTNAHFSPLIGLTHNSNGAIFQTDGNASQGIISMAETGSKVFLQEEIAVIQNLGNSAYIIDELGVGVNEQSITITFESSQDFPLLSIVSMIAPSPDWFIGVNSFALFENNQWVKNITVELNVYDAGSDSGKTFKSDNIKSTPLEVIKLLSTERIATDLDKGIHFDSKRAIATLKIKRIE